MCALCGECCLPEAGNILHTVITVRLIYLAHSVCMKPNFQGLTWSECDGLGNDELLTRFFV